MVKLEKQVNMSKLFKLAELLSTVKLVNLGLRLSVKAKNGGAWLHKKSNRDKNQLEELLFGHPRRSRLCRFFILVLAHADSLSFQNQ